MKNALACTGVMFGLLVCRVSGAIKFPPCHGSPIANVREVVETSDKELILLSAILLENEARNGAVAYCLSDAQMTNGKNGLSFGFIQSDLASNPNSLPALIDILKVARQVQPALELDAADIATIETGALSKRAVVLKESTGPGLPALIGRVNAALSSASARAAIDRQYLARLKEMVADLKSRIGNLSDNVGARTYLESSLMGRMLLLDYENFFGRMGPQFRGFLDGTAQTLRGGTVKIEGSASFTDIIMRFALVTKQGSGTSRDERAEILRRMNNVVKYYTRNVDLVPVTTSDKSFLRNTLGPIIDTSNPYIEEKRRSGQYTYLAALVQRAQATDVSP